MAMLYWARNNNKITNKSPQAPRLADQLIVCSWFSLITLYSMSSRSVPYLFGDEYGILGAAGVLSGFQWEAPEGMPFYGFLISIFAFPLFFLDLDLTSIYRAVLAINGLLIIASALLSLQVLRYAMPNINRGVLLLSIIGVFSYPAVIFYGGSAMGETALLFCIALLIFGLARLAREQQIDRLGIVCLGLSAGLAPFAHTRGLVLIVAVVPVFAIALWCRSIQFRALPYLVLIALPTYGVMATVKHWLVINFYGGGEALGPTSSASGFFKERVISALISDRFVDVAVAALGQMTYVLTATFGLVFVSLMVCLGVIKKGIPAGSKFSGSLRGGSIHTRFIVVLYIVMVSCAMFSVSVFFLGGGVRADHYFYGRYIEVILPFLLLPGLLWVAKDRRSILKLSAMGCGLLLAVSSALALTLLPEEIFQKSMIWNSISGWIIHIQGQWRIVPSDIAAGVVAGGVWLLLALWVSRWLFQVIVVVMFCLVTHHIYVTQHVGADRAWQEYASLSRDYSQFFSGLSVDATALDWKLRGDGMAFQLAAPRANVMFGGGVARSADIALVESKASCDEKQHLSIGTRIKACFNKSDVFDVESSLVGLAGTVKPARDLPAAEINFANDSVELNQSLHSICSALSRYFFMRIAMICLPKINVTVSHSELIGSERIELGFFVSDHSRRWLIEWRAPLDIDELAAGNEVSAESRVRVPVDLSSGPYKLNVAILHEKKWDWRVVESIPLYIM